LIVEPSLPAFNLLVGKKLFIDFDQFWIADSVYLVTGIMAEVPCIYLSSLNLRILKSTPMQESKAFLPKFW
jgi:hypothetical protein